MQFPIVKKEDQSLALEVPDDLLQQLTSKLSSQAEAQLKENEGTLALLKESQDKVAELEEKLAMAEGRTMDDFTSIEKAEFVIPWMRDRSAEEFVKLALHTGHEAQLAPATAAEVAEAEQKAKTEVAEEEPKTIQGKTDRPGYKYLEHINMSVRE